MFYYKSDNLIAKCHWSCIREHGNENSWPGKLYQIEDFMTMAFRVLMTQGLLLCFFTAETASSLNLRYCTWICPLTSDCDISRFSSIHTGKMLVVTNNVYVWSNVALLMTMITNMYTCTCYWHAYGGYSMNTWIEGKPSKSSISQLSGCNHDQIWSRLRSNNIFVWWKICWE